MEKKLYKAVVELTFSLEIDVHAIHEDNAAAIAEDIANDLGYDLEEEINEDFNPSHKVRCSTATVAETGRDKKRWVDTLPADVYQRLGNCNSRYADIPILVSCKLDWMMADPKYARTYTKEDALVWVLELLDSNGQYFDLTKEEYEKLAF